MSTYMYFHAEIRHISILIEKKMPYFNYGDYICRLVQAFALCIPIGSGSV